MADMDLRILKVVFENAWGGLEMNVCRFSENFRNLGHDVMIIARQGSKIEKYCWENMIPVMTINPKTDYLDIITAIKIAKIIKKRKIDIIQAYISRDLSTLVLAKKLARRGKLIFRQGMDSRYNKKDLFHKWVFRNVDMVVTVTEQVKSHLLENTPVRVGQAQCITNGIFPEKYEPRKIDGLRFKYGIPENAFVIGLTGRLDRLKKQELLVEAAPHILKKHKNCHFVFVGEETDSKTGRGYKDVLERRIKSMGLEYNFAFTGFVDDIRDILPMFDVSVLTTPKETFGMVVIESMAMGVPVVATREGGPLEIIEEDKTGLFFEPGDVDGLSKSILKLIDDSTLLRKMSKNGVKAVNEKFNLHKKLAEYERLYFNLSTPIY